VPFNEAVAVLGAALEEILKKNTGPKEDRLSREMYIV